PFTGQIAVLMNRGSASASEIACAALKDWRDAVLVGQKSMGAVLASVYGPLPDGFELQYPVQDYITIKGERLEGHPRVPDLDVASDPGAPDDVPQKALDFLRKRVALHSNTQVSTTGHESPGG
ncbi:MAG TPA: S41 family peptidase, partial [Fimbriimonadaceae bacterium]|nr:S41 family peptidase [Fimbriimonadaceae bacterium]